MVCVRSLNEVLSDSVEDTYEPRILCRIGGPRFDPAAFSHLQ